MSTAFMICGNTGAGKSTYANQLAQQQKAVVFSLDQWMQVLFVSDYNSLLHDFNWITNRTNRCKEEIYKVAQRLIELNINVIMDIGFMDKESRSFCGEWASSLGAESSLHYLNVSVEERRKRVQKRNAEKGNTFAFEVTEDMFNYIEPLFEVPTENELINGLII